MKNKEGAAGKNASNHAQNAESAITLRGGNTVVDAPQGRQETGFSVSLPGPASVHGGGGGGGGMSPEPAPSLVLFHIRSGIRF